MATAVKTKESALVDWLDQQVEVLYQEVLGSSLVSRLQDPAMDPGIVRRILREIYLEVAWYQPTIIEKAVSIIGQMPRTVNPRDLKAMLGHQADEFDHGEMALRDYVALGGDEQLARDTRLMSPTAHAICGFWCMLEHQRDPAAYLGALYLFEGLTPQVSQLAQQIYATRGLTGVASEFINFHATEDIKHTKLVRHLITRVADSLPGADAAIRRGFAGFRHVYPLPAWLAAMSRALAGGP